MQQRLPFLSPSETGKWAQTTNNSPLSIALCQLSINFANETEFNSETINMNC